MGERGAWQCQRNHKYFIMLNQMEKPKQFLFQVEVAKTSFHSRLIGAQPSVLRDQKGTAKTVKHKYGPRTPRAGEGCWGINSAGHEVG